MRNATAQWTSVNSGSTGMYESVYFFDASNGIASSTSDVIKTSDGGSTWTKITVAGIRDIDFASSTIGYAAGISGHEIYKTINGGTTWTALTPLQSSKNLWGVSVIDANTFYVCGNNGIVWKSTNGGTSFTAVNIASAGNLVDIDFANANEGCALELNGKVWRTTNGGTTWTNTYATIGVTFSDMSFVDAYTGFVVGSGGSIIKTINGGASWANLTSNSISYLQYVDFYNPLNGIAAGLNGIVLHTINGGNTWTNEITGINTGLYSCTYLTTHVAIAAGSNGIMIKNTALPAGIEQFSKNNVFAINPNPASDYISVEIENVSNKPELISIIDMQGKLLLQQTSLQSVSDIDVSLLPQGIYILKLENEMGVTEKKFIKK